jgi:uncharacterized lipoprotein YmbA
MKATAILALTFTLAFALSLTGCVNLKPKPDRTQIFTLAADLQPVEAWEGLPEVYVTRVELPGFLEGTRIHYRAAKGELESFAGARWAEAPFEALPRAIAMHLQATGKVKVRAYYPWAQTSRALTKVSVQFERFSANADGQVEVVARWQIETADGSLNEGRYIAEYLQWDGQEVADYVTALDAGLNGLAEAIAREFQEALSNDIGLQ